MLCSTRYYILGRMNISYCYSRVCTSARI